MALACKIQVIRPEQVKPIAAMEDTFDQLDIRVGRAIDVELETRTPEPTYKIAIDFSKVGSKLI